MDKLVNHQIVSMRKDVKTAKTWILRKIFRDINRISRNIKKWESHPNGDEQKKKRLEELKRKLDSKKNDALTLRPLQPDLISKQALVYDIEHFQTILQKPKSTVEERAIARVAQHKLIQAIVQKFREEIRTCGWIELWDEQKEKTLKTKNEKKTTKNQKGLLTPKRKEKKIKNQTEPNVVTPSKKTSYTPVFQVTELDSDKPKEEKEILKKPSLKTNPTLENLPRTISKAAVIKRVNLGDELIINGDDHDDSSNSPNEFQTPESRKVKDNFFLRSDDEDDDEFEDLNDDEIEKEPMTETKFLGYRPTPKRFKSFDKRAGSGSNQTTPVNNRFPNQSFRSPGSRGRFDKPKPIVRRYFNADNEQPSKPNTPTTPQRSGAEAVHPSWKAKMEAKQKQKLVIPSDSGPKPNKHIKFT